MLFECKVYDKNGKLAKVHTVAELEENSRKICLSLLSDIDRQIIENFDFASQDEYEVEIGNKKEAT